MVGAVRLDAVSTESLTGTESEIDQLLAQAKFNSVAYEEGCVTNLVYNGDNVEHKHFTFEIALSGCLVTTTTTHNGEK